MEKPKENENILETIIETAPACVKLIAADGTLKRMNRAGLAMIEADSLEQVKGQSVYSMVSEEYRESFKSLTQDVFNGKSGTLEFKMVGLKGRSLWLYTHAAPLRNEKGEVILLVAITIDITERKEAVKALQENEQRLKKAQQIAHIGDWEWEIATNRVHWSDELYRIYGYEPHEIAPDYALIVEAMHPDSKEQFLNAIDAVLKGERPFEMDYTFSRKDGSVAVLHTIGNVLYDKDGSPERMVGTVQDITERKKAEDALRESEKFRAIFDSSSDGLLIANSSSKRFIAANQKILSMLGYTKEEILSMGIEDIHPKDSRPHVMEEYEKQMKGEIIVAPNLPVMRKEGTVFYADVSTTFIMLGGIHCAVGTFRDVTERHLLEEERLKTQKLEAIGTLAGGIAHDFNNLLQGVFGYISMAKSTLDQKEKSLDMLDQAERALHMSVNLTTQLLTFSKGGKPVKKKIMLQPIIDNSVRFALSGSRVDYRIEVDKALCMIEADEGQIGQVIQNIVLNSDQAMPMGGMVVITARNVHAPQKGLPALLRDGNYVEISVKDTGIGIPDHYLSRIFDPYFTTKEKGSGLGLATSYSIIKNHGGLIDITSEMGKGSTFYIYLPAIEEDREKVETISATAAIVRKGRILVMDDEEFVRDVAGEMIRQLGHEAEFALNGEEAVIKYREAMSLGKRFDIVILDLTVRGGMGGEEAIRELLAIDPDINAVVSSGYTANSTISEYRNRGFKASLTKPYTIKGLEDTLNALLR